MRACPCRAVPPQQKAPPGTATSAKRTGPCVDLNGVVPVSCVLPACALSPCACVKKRDGATQRDTDNAAKKKERRSPAPDLRAGSAFPGGLPAPFLCALPAPLLLCAPSRDTPARGGVCEAGATGANPARQHLNPAVAAWGIGAWIHGIRYCYSPLPLRPFACGQATTEERDDTPAAPSLLGAASSRAVYYDEIPTGRESAQRAQRGQHSRRDEKGTERKRDRRETPSKPGWLSLPMICTFPRGCVCVCHREKKATVRVFLSLDYAGANVSDQRRLSCVCMCVCVCPCVRPRAGRRQQQQRGRERSRHDALQQREAATARARVCVRE